MNTGNDTKRKEFTDVMTLTDDYCCLVVWNDEVNTFDWVIQALIEICNHSEEQAEQCAIIIDSKGLHFSHKNQAWCSKYVS